jgi:hypothetical protein
MLEEALSKLSPNLRGSVITPASGEYETARKVYNGMIDRRPDAIVRCANVADVRASVNFAREEGLTVAVALLWTWKQTARPPKDFSRHDSHGLYF